MGEMAVAEAALGILKLLMEAAAGAGRVLEKRTKGSVSQRIARFVYWETVYNSLIVDLARGLMPPRVVATRHEWDQPGRAEALAEILIANEASNWIPIASFSETRSETLVSDFEVRIER